MVSLEIDGTGFAFVAVKGPAGDAGYLLITDNRFSIEDNGDQPTYKGDIIRLPFAGLFRRLFTG